MACHELQMHGQGVHGDASPGTLTIVGRQFCLRCAAARPLAAAIRKDISASFITWWHAPYARAAGCRCAPLAGKAGGNPTTLTRRDCTTAPAHALGSTSGLRLIIPAALHGDQLAPCRCDSVPAGLSKST